MKIKVIVVFVLFYSLGFKGLSQNLEIAWEKQIGTPNSDFFTDVIEDLQGGFTVTGSVRSPDNSDLDFWIVRFEQNGDILWQKYYGTPDNDYSYCIAQFPEGDYILAGKTSNENNVRPHLLKADKEGNEIWQKTIEADNRKFVKDIIAMDDRTFIVCGTQESDNAEKIWLAGFNTEGELLWEKTYGEETSSDAEALRKLPDGGFALAGKCSEKGKSVTDMWLFRFDKTGEKIWDKKISKTNSSVRPECICCSSDNNILSIGWLGTCMNDINSENPIFDYDLFLVKISPEGKEIWSKNIDSEGSEGGNAVTVRPDGKILMAGKKETSFLGRIGP